MIERYSRKEMTAIWSDASRFAIWLEIEILACEAQAELQLIPNDAARRIRANAHFDEDRIKAIEAEVHHDVIAFLTSVGESLGDEARYVHRGLTSSDIIDSAFAVQLCNATDILLNDLTTLRATLKKQAQTHKNTIMMGRSHGIHGEPISFGFKMAQAHAEFSRWQTRLQQAKKDIAHIALSGAMGTFAHLPPQVEAHVAKKLNMACEPISTQVIARDRHGFYFSVLAGIASSVERLAVEVRHWQRSEVGEAMEPFGKQQKGSSAMPHKRNPVLAENLTGLARLVRSFAIPALENIALWHERDISHSSVERVIAPDATITLDFALHRLNGVMAGLEVNEEAMARNLEASHGLWASGVVLLMLTEAGMARDNAYRLVQSCAFDAHKNQTNFADIVLAHKEITAHCSPSDLKKQLQPSFYLRHIDEIMARVFDNS